MAMQSNIAFILGYGLIVYMIGLMAWPYLSTIIFATILSGTFYPLRCWFIDHLKLGKALCASLTLLVIILTLFLPTIYLIVGLSQEALSLFTYLKATLTEEFLEQVLFGEGLFGQGYLPRIMEDMFIFLNMDYNVTTIQGLILDSAKFTSSYLINMVNHWVGNIFSFLFHLLLMLVIIFTILVDGEKIKVFFLRLSPLPTEEENQMIHNFNQMNYATLIGNGLGGAMQGVIAGMGFWFVGFESILLWTTAMVVLAFIPMVGMSFIFIPAGIFLLLTGKIGYGVGLLIYCTLTALFVEQWYKPKFVGNRVQINSVLVFLSIIGGMSVYGFLGIFYGPLIISIFLTFVVFYHKRYSDFETEAEQFEVWNTSSKSKRN